MHQWIVWFNVVSFSLMFCAFAFLLFSYVSNRAPWLRSYLLYLASFAVWLMLSTWYFFRVTYITTPVPGLDLAVGWARVTVSLVMSYAAPLLVVQLDKGQASRTALVLLAAVPAAILLAIVAYSLFGVQWIGTPLNIAFNTFLVAIAARGMKILRRATPDPRAASLRMFFVMSIILYGLFVLYAVANAALSVPVPPEANVILTGFFGLCWSILVIADQLRAVRARAAEGGALPAFFLEEYGITDREGGIIQLLSRGTTTREIGRQLFVSPRTVETHAYNIYRKCGVSNKVELLNLIDSCRGR